MIQVRSCLYFLSKAFTLLVGFKSVFIYAGIGGALYLGVNKSKQYIVQKMAARQRSKILNNAVDDYGFESQYLKTISPSATLERRAIELEKALKELK